MKPAAPTTKQPTQTLTRSAVDSISPSCCRSRASSPLATVRALEASTRRMSAPSQREPPMKMVRMAMAETTVSLHDERYGEADVYLTDLTA